LNPVAELESPAVSTHPDFSQPRGLARHGALLVATIAAVIYCTGMIGPPSLMDDVDSAQAQIARNMLSSGDFVSARMDGVLYLEKSPLIYWLMAGSFRIFGPHDWAARIPIALGAILLCWLTFRIANWAFGEPAGLYAGLTMTSSVGLYIFTRVLIPDVLLTLAITLTLP
jgi:4-amino-4-deoxy-L-arabinose transferase-like glycosyltransferase